MSHTNDSNSDCYIIIKIGIMFLKNSLAVYLNLVTCESTVRSYGRMSLISLEFFSLSQTVSLIPRSLRMHLIVKILNF